jgi:hypothetical protein
MTLFTSIPRHPDAQARCIVTYCGKGNILTINTSILIIF